MKISNEQIKQSMALPPRQPGEPATVAELEEFAAVLQKTREVLDAMPDVRPEHILEAMHHIEPEGATMESTVAADDIAEKLLGRSLSDNIS